MRKFYLLLLSLLILQSCKNNLLNVKEVEVEGWEPLVALPLIHSTLSLEKLLASGDSNVIKIDNEKFITLAYEKHIKTLLAPDVVQLDNQAIAEDLSMTGPEITILTGTGTVTFSRTITVDFDLSGDGVADDVLFDNGNLAIMLKSHLKHDLHVEITIPAATKSGQPLKVSLDLPYSGSSPVSDMANLSLAGYLFDFDFNDPSKENKFDINLTITANFKNNPVSSGDIIDASFSFESMDLKYFHGYVGHEVLSAIGDTLKLPVFDNQIGTGSFNIADPQVGIRIRNGFGIPIEMAVNKLEFLDKDIGVIPFTGSGVPSVLVLNTPTQAEYGQQVLTALDFNKSNSNIKQVLDAMPEKLIFNISPEINPAATKVQNFVIDDVGMDIDLLLNLPLYGSASNFVLQDTLEFSISSPEQLLSLMLRTNLTNGFPIDLEMQVYLADEKYQILDSLIKTDYIIVASALVNPQSGRVTSPVHKKTDIVLSDSMMGLLPKVKYLLVTGKLSTFNNGNTDVKIYSDYELEVKIGVLAKIKGHF